MDGLGPVIGQGIRDAVRQVQFIDRSRFYHRGFSDREG